MMMRVSCLSILLCLLGFNVQVQAKECSTEKLATILSPATKQDNHILVDCSFRLKKGDVITKQIVFSGEEASNLELDCGGATIHSQFRSPSILITSRLVKERWSVPHDIQIKNCTISNSLRIKGIGKNGQDDLLKPLSYQATYTKQVQEAAPYNIVLDHLRLIAATGNMMYFAPGVHHVTLQNSQFVGQTTGLALYLDAESGWNIIKNNVFDVQTKSRELIAVDGSAYNTIESNQFIHPSNGAIFLYRNCGEGGVVRHQTPTFNQILSNTFQVDKIMKKPQIWLASRNGGKSYCDLDKGYNFGSSKDNLDHAQDNVVMKNILLIKPTLQTDILKRIKRLDDYFIRVDAQPNQVKENLVQDKK